MIRRALFVLIFAAAICGTVFAADNASTDEVPSRAELKDYEPTAREEMSPDSDRKERMAPISSQQGGSAPRATIDIGDAALPKPVQNEKAEEIVIPETPKEDQKAVPAENIAPVTPALNNAVVQKPKKVVWKWGFKKKTEEEGAESKVETLPTPSISTEVQTEVPVESAPTITPKSEDVAVPVITEGPGENIPVKVEEPVKLKEKAGKQKPEKVIFRWMTPNKKELPKEEEIQRKIEGKPFKGETGFTTVKTYINKSIKASGVPEPKEILIENATVMLNIDDCIKIAAANNIQAVVAKKSIKLAEMRVFEARRNLLPSAMIAVERSKGTVSNNDYLGRKQYIDLQQPIFHGGELYFAMKQAEVNLQISKNDYNRVNNELVLQVKKAYYTLEKAKENSVLQGILSREVEKMYGISSKGYEAGVIAKVEYLNVSSQASQVKYQLASAEGDASIAELILRQTMNVNPREKFGIIPSPELKKITLDFEKTMYDAFTNRPEIKAGSLMISYYSYGKGIANAKSLPKVDLLGQWGLAWEDYVPSETTILAGRSPRRDLQPQWYAGIKVGVPFAGNTAEYSYTREQWTPVVQTLQGTEATVNSFKFKILDKLDMFSDNQLAIIDYDRSRQEMNKTKNDVTLEVREGCFNYEKAIIQLETAANKVKYQEADSELMRMKRGMDEIQDSNVIDSLIKVAQEKFGYVQAVTDCKTSLAALEKAVGVEDYFKNR